MEHKLIMENWRKYKKSLDESPMAVNVASTGYEVYDDPEEITSEFVEFLLEMIAIFFTQPSVVMNNSIIWPILQKYGVNIVNYKIFTLETAGKSLSRAQKNAMAQLTARSVQGRLAFLLADKTARWAVVSQLFIKAGPIFGPAIKYGAIAWMLYEIMKISFDLTGKAMKSLGYKDTYDELGNYNWDQLGRDFDQEMFAKLNKALPDWLRKRIARVTSRPLGVRPPGRGKDVSPEVYNKNVKSEENFDTWTEEDQIGWCLRNSTPKNYKGPLTCKAVLDKADPKEVARIRKILGTDRGAGKTDDKFAMSVPAID